MLLDSFGKSPFETVSVPTPKPGDMGLMLDNIRSIYNVGALFRTANGAAISFLFCCGMSATPEHPKVAKTALGAQSWHQWQYQTNSLQTAVSLQQNGWQIWAIEKADYSEDLFTLKKRTHDPIILVCGNERAGVDPAILNIADKVVSLPMMGQKESLNVAVATGVVVYTLKFGLQS
ncbi:MAG: TrmH family RNA methyltransferase [Chloroflexota bacterium]